MPKQSVARDDEDVLSRSRRRSHARLAQAWQTAASRVGAVLDPSLIPHIPTTMLILMLQVG